MHMKLWKRLSLVLVILILLNSGNVLAETVTPSVEHNVLVYMTGSDLETDYYAATDDIIEMINGDLGDNVTITIQTGGAYEWHTNEVGLSPVLSQYLQRFSLTENEMVLLETLPLASMGESETLADFIQSAYIDDPMTTNTLILWNHGAGAVYGYGADELFDYDTLSLLELQQAMALAEVSLGSGNLHFDLIGFDACLMGSVETAMVLEPYTDYMIGSEELEPGHGWDYTAIVDYLGNAGDFSVVGLGNEILASFKKSARESGSAEAITLSLLDLSGTEKVLYAMDQLLDVVSQDLREAAMTSELLKIRLASESYGEGSSGDGVLDSDMVDMMDLAYGLSELYPTQAFDLMDAISAMVLDNVNSSYKPKASGLSMYYPARDHGTIPGAYDLMTALEMPEGYLSMIDALRDLYLESEEIIIIEGDTQETDDAFWDEVVFDGGTLSGDDTYFYFNVSPSDLDVIDEIHTVMGFMDEDDDIQYLGKEVVDSDHIIEDGTILGVTKDTGIELNGLMASLYFEEKISENVYSYSIPILLNDRIADLMVMISPTYPQGKILGARLSDSNYENLYNRTIIGLEPNDVITLIYEYDLLDDWDGYYYYDGWYMGDSFEVLEGLELNWVPYPDGVYTYCFEILDIYGGIYYSDWLTYEIDKTSDQSLIFMSDDVPSDWAKPYINAAYTEGLTVPSVLVDFEADIDRESFCELVVNLVEHQTGKTIAVANPYVFEDTTSVAVAKAYQIGIVGGYGNGMFGPDDPILREQLMTMFFRAMAWLEPQVSSNIYPSVAYDDFDKVNDYAANSVKAMIYYGIVNGVSETEIAPQNHATKEQAIKMIYVLHQYLTAEE